MQATEIYGESEQAGDLSPACSISAPRTFFHLVGIKRAAATPTNPHPVLVDGTRHQTAGQIIDAGLQMLQPLTAKNRGKNSDLSVELAIIVGDREERVGLNIMGVFDTGRAPVIWRLFDATVRIENPVRCERSTFQRWPRQQEAGVDAPPRPEPQNFRATRAVTVRGSWR